jgi:hypothetical protein
VTVRCFTSLVFVCAAVRPAAAQQTFTGTISDNLCGISHQTQAGRGPSSSLVRSGLTDRQCVVACIDKLAKYVLVDDAKHVIPIANQDAPGLPFHAGRRVKLTGERKGDAIVVTKVERLPAEGAGSVPRY